MALIFKNTGQGGNITIKNNGLGGSLRAIESTRPVSSGIAFRVSTASRYTSARTGDAGWRWQNGWFNYTPPTNPKVIASLNYSTSGGKAILQTPLIVNGVSSTIRFVSVKGTQDWTSTGQNENLITIDKLSGLGIYRPATSSTNWEGQIDAALALSVTVNGIVYSDWYLVSLEEFYDLFDGFAVGNNFVDPNTSAIYKINDGGATYVSSEYRRRIFGGGYASDNAIDNNRGIFITKDTRNLISA